jgi:Fe-S-cluster-containing dehydrogenase component/CRP-like cAMP-binding protein
MSAPSGTSGAAGLVGFLSQVPFLTRVPHEDLEPLAQSAVVRRYGPGASVVVQGEFGHSMFLLIEGALGIHATSDEGVRLDLGRLEKPGDFFGEVALLGRGVRSATVVTQGDTVLLEIEKNRFDLLARRHDSALEELEKYYHARSIATYTRLHRYLGQLDEQGVREVTAGARMRKFRRDEVVAKSGDAADTVLLIKDGVLKAVRPGRDGKLSILAYFNTHDVVGAHDSNTRGYDLVALGQAEVIFLPRAAFSKMGQKRPDVFARFGKDDMQRQEVLARAGGTVFGAAQAFLQAGVEVESLLVINLDRCVRCGNCVRACHARHAFTRLDRRGPIFRRRKAIASKQHEHILIPSSCRHCRDPECMIGCPTGAIQRFPDGDVDINDNCIGCENCARKCPYGNITMRPLAEGESKQPNVTKRAIKCNLCRGFSYSNCVHECPRGAVLRVDPLRYFDELALVMEAEQRDAIEWQRNQAKQVGQLGAKQRVKPRSTWFVWVSLLFLVAGLAGVLALYLAAPGPHRGGTTLGLGFGTAAAACIGAALFLGARKRMRNTPIGPLEVWTQFHMVIGILGFVLALAHAGFRITGVATTVLLLVFALEVLTGVLGQAIYMIAPRILTRLERAGLAKLIEDLYEEELELERGVLELRGKLGRDVVAELDRRLPAATGSIGSRFKKSYDPTAAADRAASLVAQGSPDEETGNAVARIARDTARLKDIRAQLLLHRSMKSWLVLHVATAGALAVFVVGHIVGMLLLM